MQAALAIMMSAAGLPWVRSPAGPTGRPDLQTEPLLRSWPATRQGQGLNYPLNCTNVLSVLLPGADFPRLARGEPGRFRAQPGL